MYLCFGKEKNKNIQSYFLFTGLWLFISYVLWLTMFTITRYYIILELFVAMFIVKFFVEFLPQARIAKILFISIGIVVFYSLVMTPFFSDTWEQRKDDYQLKQNLLYDLTKKSQHRANIRVYQVISALLILKISIFLIIL